MKQTLIALLLTGTFLAACGGRHEQQPAYLSGKIEGVGTDTLYLYGADRLFLQTDTIVAHSGKFKAEVAVDTMVQTWLLLPSGVQYPLFLNKGDHVKVQGRTDSDAWKVTGNALNEELSEFLSQAAAQSDESSRRKLAETFVNQHPKSLASVYVLDRFFLSDAKPDCQQVQRMLGKLAGELRDRPAVAAMEARVKESLNLSKGHSIPYFNFSDTLGHLKKRREYKEQVLLLQVWATYSKTSPAVVDSLKALYKKHRGESDFVMLGVSMDVDTVSWLRTVRADSLPWKQVRDPAGLQGEFVQHAGISELPVNLLLNPRGNILAIDPTNAEVEQKLSDHRSSQRNNKNP